MFDSAVTLGEVNSLCFALSFPLSSWLVAARRDCVRIALGIAGYACVC